MTWRGFKDQIWLMAMALLMATILYAANQISSIPAIKDALATIESNRFTDRDQAAYARLMEQKNQVQDEQIRSLDERVRDLERRK
jgi:hypothetical protein